MAFRFALFFCLTLLTACASTPTETNTAVAQPATATPTKFDYPTRDRVQYVLDCIAQHAETTIKFGGINYVTQYACGCKIDKIAEKLSFEEFESALASGYLSKLAGEAGGVFRNNQKDLRKQYKEIEQEAEKACFVK